MNRSHCFLLIAALMASWVGVSQQITPKGVYLHNDKGMRSLGAVSGKEFEKRFISQTIEHHRGSIELSKRALKVLMPEALKKRAQAIIARSEREIKLLNNWLAKWYKMTPIVSEEHVVRSDMAKRMRAPIYSSRDYILQMVAHEEEEVQMGQLVAKNAVHKQLTSMVGMMISRGEHDIQYFVNLLSSAVK